MGSLSTKEPLCRAQQSAWCSRMMLNDYCCHYLSRVSSHADPTTATADLTATASSTLWRAPSGVSAAVSWACPPSELALSDCVLQPVGRKTQVRGGRARWLFPSVGAGGGGGEGLTDTQNRKKPGVPAVRMAPWLCNRGCQPRPAVWVVLGCA